MEGKKNGASAGEKRRFRQLMVCLLLFGVVFMGRGVDFTPVSRLAATVGEAVREDIDFQAVFSRFGESFSKGAPAVETFRVLLGGGPEENTENTAPLHSGENAPTLETEEAAVSSEPAGDEAE